MARIFISYSRADRQFVDEFVPLLRRMYDSLWFDDDIHGGSDWWQTILSEIADCDLFIYLVSNDSLGSPYCQAELREALRLHKAILPVIIRLKTEYPNRVDDDLKDILSKTQYVDLSRGFKDHRAITELYAAANYLLAAVPARTPTPLNAYPTKQPIVSDKPQRSFKARWTMAPVIGLLAIGAVIIGILASQGDDDNSGQSSGTKTALALITSDTPTIELTNSPTPTETPGPTDTATPTLDIVFVVQTLDAAATIEQATLNVQATAAARATEYAVGTQSAFDQTATATLFTFTPTPNITASIEAYRTQQAATITQAWIDSWTDTPTPTQTPTNTPTATFTPTLTPTPTTIPAGSSNKAVWPEPIIQTFDGVEMVYVPAGCFMMGSKSGYSDEQPLHEVCLDAFWIDRTEVTNEQYGSVGCSDYSSAPNQPRNCVSWIDASAFCESRGVRLPTEAEWEYAARGPEGLIYPWGNEFVADNAIYADNSGNHTADVGSKLGGASWVGALDISGNVWEWVADWYDAEYYATLTDGAKNPTGPANGDPRVLRGGSWNDLSVNVRTANRFGLNPSNWVNPNNGGNDNGFRCARSAE